MEKIKFLKDLEDVLQREEDCKETDMLDDYDEWDSLAKMAVMAYFDRNFGIKLKLNTFKELKTVSDLINLAGDKIK